MQDISTLSASSSFFFQDTSTFFTSTWKNDEVSKKNDEVSWKKNDEMTWNKIIEDEVSKTRIIIIIFRLLLILSDYALLPRPLLNTGRLSGNLKIQAPKTGKINNEYCII